MTEQQAQSQRFNGTVAVFFTAHYQVTTRDWDNIREFNGPHHPLAGPYRSDDPVVLTRQLHEMRRAGIDAIVYDCYGFREWTLTDMPKDRTLAMLADSLDHQSNETRKLKLIIWLEKYMYNPTLEEYRFALDYVRKHLAGREFYVAWQGRPLVLTYHNGDNQAIDEVEWENDFFTLRRVRPYQSDVWSYINHYPQRLSREWMVASPGFDPYLENAYIETHVKKEPNVDLDALRRDTRKHAADREDGAYFRKQLLRAREGDPAFLFLSGWNDWQYASQIEPAVEYGFQYVDMAARLLGRQAETAPYRA